ncbi:uncharacterized protein CC84DRAFT_520637 [Paraphaeosphaeria sporulosa]|uniref:Uncharacterized protein n=1 Tax=Paraphaeosphaeria sporulosa TaxID=1460663 RepID=A0A177CJZ3_9PLEO|nr:uncharacterized protein CC84DRAFT_520637 [Paraphaeosphaeria sporulosa]OAG07813.1 hypothetical protein CC84DRAFT_520637 [Paraphaeosphaeria sporulosa]
MDLFICYPEYHVLVCRSCAYAVAPPHLAAHMATKHANDICSKDNLHRTTKVAATLATRLREEYDLLDPTTSIIPRPPPTKPPFPNLKPYPRAAIPGRHRHPALGVDRTASAHSQPYGSRRTVRQIARKQGNYQWEPTLLSHICCQNRRK